MRLEIVDHLTDPGTPGKPNDDAACFAGGLMAAVFDGATGLGDSLIFPNSGSDAAWLAQLAARVFSMHGIEAEVGDMVRDAAREARAMVEAVLPLDSLPRFAWPTSGFEMARLRNGVLELSGLGDCCAYVLGPDGVLVTHTAMPSSREVEMASARRMLDAAGGFGPGGGIVREGPTMEAMRRGRARHNAPGGAVWTLGLVPEAGDHVSILREAARPGTMILLMSDGFSALCEAYQMYDEKGLVEAAARGGLDEMLRRLREVERIEDPRAERFARFKQSDDATAILAQVTA
jgi:hypothetical protein